MLNRESGGKKGRIIFNFLSEGLSKGDGEEKKGTGPERSDCQHREACGGGGKRADGEDSVSSSTRVPGEVSPAGAERWHEGRLLLLGAHAGTCPSSHTVTGEGIVHRVCSTRAVAGVGCNSQLPFELSCFLRELGAGLQ